MLIELWEHWRGYDKWVETEATVESSERESYPTRYGEGILCDDVLLWTDRNGDRHRAGFTIEGDSSLSQLDKDSTITIRYNPGDPEQYYLRELLQARAGAAAARIVVVAFFIGLALFLVLSRSSH